MEKNEQKRLSTLEEQVARIVAQLAALYSTSSEFAKSKELLLNTALTVTSHNETGPLMKAISYLVDTHGKDLAQSPSIRFLRQRALDGNFPTTANEISAILMNAFSPKLNPLTSTILQTLGGRNWQVLCYENPVGVCNDSSCDSKCIVLGWAGGDCIHCGVEIQGLFGVDPCNCFGEPHWYEVALWALFFLLLLLTPGPDELAGVGAAIARFLVRIPAVAVP